MTRKKAILLGLGSSVLLAGLFVASLPYISRIYTLAGSVEVAPRMYFVFPKGKTPIEQEGLASYAIDALAFDEQRFGRKLEGELLVHVYTVDEWKTLGDEGEFAGGYYQSAYLKSLGIHAISVPLGFNDATLRHEIGHAMVEELGDAKPLLNEGIAHFLETDDGFNVYWANMLLRYYPTHTGKETFERKGETVTIDHLLEESDTARATGWLVAYSLFNRGRSLQEIAKLKDSEVPTQKELIAEMPSVALRFAKHAGIETLDSVKPQQWLYAFWSLRTKYGTESSMPYYKEQIEKQGYVHDPDFLRSHAWLLAANAKRRGEDPKKFLDSLSKSDFFSQCSACYPTLDNWEHKFVLELGAQLVDESGFLESYYRSVINEQHERKENGPESLVDTLHRYSVGKEMGLYAVETGSWAFAYYKFAKGMTRDQFLALEGPLELTAEMVSELDALPKIKPTESGSSIWPPVTSDSIALSREMRKYLYLDRRYHSNETYWRTRSQ